jgi:hypothetical protein
VLVGVGRLGVLAGAEGGDLDGLRPLITCTILKRRPMMRERRKAARTSSGVALVATS